MSYTYPEALNALESIANDYIKLLRPNVPAPVNLVCDVTTTTASVRWEPWGVTITMPVRPASSTMTQTEFEDWTAYLLHELGHPTYTDLTTWKTAVRLGLACLLNAVEDVRMEQAIITSGIVPNAKTVLARLLGRKVIEARSAGVWNPNSRKDIAWTICVLGRAANGYPFNAADMAWIKSRIKPGSTVGAILGWALPELALCRSTDDCLTLAAKISKAIAAPQGEPGQQGMQGRQGGQGQQGGQGGQSEQQGEQQDEQQSEQQGEAPQISSESPTGENDTETGSERGEPENATSDAPTPPIAADNAQGEGKGGRGSTGCGDGSTDEDPVIGDSELTDASLAPKGELAANPGIEKTVIDILRNSVMSSTPQDARTPSKRMSTMSKRLQEGAAKASKQRGELARALRANETDDKEGGRKAGRLDRGALSRAMSGATNVFARRDICEGFDTDVAILLDASGSMQGAGLAAALEAGLVIAQAAGSVGASCTTEIFNSSGYWRAGTVGSKRAPSAAEFGTLASCAGGGTPLSAHIARMAMAQSKRAAHKRRVVFVVTDGGCDYGTHTIKRMVSHLEKTCGTVFAHVSIGMPLRNTFKAEVMVPYDTSLANVGLTHFARVLQAL